MTTHDRNKAAQIATEGAILQGGRISNCFLQKNYRPMPFLSTIYWVVWKDLISEWRTRETISSMLFFALIVILVFSFSFAMDQDAARQLIAGIIWVAFTFTGIIGIGKSFTSELQKRLFRILANESCPQGSYLSRESDSQFSVYVRGGDSVISPLRHLFQPGGGRSRRHAIPRLFPGHIGLIRCRHTLSSLNCPNSRQGSYAPRLAFALGRSGHDRRRRSHSRHPEWRSLCLLFPMAASPGHL